VDPLSGPKQFPVLLSYDSPEGLRFILLPLDPEEDLFIMDIPKRAESCQRTGYQFDEVSKNGRQRGAPWSVELMDEDPGSRSILDGLSSRSQRIGKL
jgi:hypothetical protein